MPAGIDVISVDGYGICTEEEAVHEWCAGVNASEAQWHRNSYEQLLYPKLMPHQRVAVIPGLLGCSTPEQAGGCEEDVTISGRCFCFVSGTDLSPAGQSKWLLRKLDEYFAWAADDERLVGMVPWHYGNRKMPTTPSYEKGAIEYPDVVAKLFSIGWRNVSQFPTRCEI